VARFDKYEPHVGGFRARLAANWLLADVAVLIAVGLDANGRVVKGAGNAGCLGVVALGKVRQAGDQIDTMTFGEIVTALALRPVRTTTSRRPEPSRMCRWLLA
jgi:hypothetical protein